MAHLQTDNGTYVIDHLIGKVLSSRQYLETRISSQLGSSNQPPIVSSRTIVHDELFLLDKNGKEHPFQFHNFHVAYREGHTLALLKATKSGEKDGGFFAVINMSTDIVYYHRAALKKILAKGWRRGSNLFILACTVTGFLVGIALGSNGSINPALGGLIPGFILVILYNSLDNSGKVDDFVKNFSIKKLLPPDADTEPPQWAINLGKLS